MSVTNFEITRQFPYADGQPFGKYGPYEQIDGLITFSVNPGHPANGMIVDLDKAPLDQNNCVKFTADLSIIKPVKKLSETGRLIIELPNRGRKTIVNTFNMTGKGVSSSPPPGDGFLFNHGFTVASIGWQWDVYRDELLIGLEAPLANIQNEKQCGQTLVEIRPNIFNNTWLLADRIHKPLRVADINSKNATLYVRNFENAPIEEIPFNQWRFAKETNNGIISSDQHIYLDSGFNVGKQYYVVYSTKDAPVVGSGLLAVRDTASALRYDRELFNTEIGPFDHVFGYGTSQTGRMLRHFLYLGLNIDENNRKVFDGLLPHVAGARRGAFNHRFAQPSNQSYPSFGHLFPYRDLYGKDPITKNKDGLLYKLSEHDKQPKIVFTNTSAEYWRGDCSLMHASYVDNVDLPEHKNSRIYHFSGTQHGPGKIPQTRDGAPEGALGKHPYNVIDHVPLLRAAFINLVKWVEQNIEPPQSRYPNFKDETAQERNTVLKRFDNIPDVVKPDPLKLFTIRELDLGEHSSDGIAEYPSKEGQNYNCVVSSVNQDGNELGGIRLPDVSQAIATHTGWNTRDPSTGGPDQMVPMLGFSLWFAKTKKDRSKNKDPRKSIEERYSSRQSYEHAVKKDTLNLIGNGYLLPEDENLVIHNAMVRYDYIVNK